MSFHMSWRTTDEDGQPGIAQVKPCLGCDALVANRERCQRCALDGGPGERVDPDRLGARRRAIAILVVVTAITVLAAAGILALAWRLEELERLAKNPHMEQR